jgi:hypothetical protein
VTDRKTMSFDVGQKVRLRAEGSLWHTDGTVTARDEEWLSVEFEDCHGPYTLKLGFDYEEGFWYDEGDSGLWLDLRAVDHGGSIHSSPSCSCTNP